MQNKKSLDIKVKSQFFFNKVEFVSGATALRSKELHSNKPRDRTRVNLVSARGKLKTAYNVHEMVV